MAAMVFAPEPILFEQFEKAADADKLPAELLNMLQSIEEYSYGRAVISDAHKVLYLLSRQLMFNELDRWFREQGRGSKPEGCRLRYDSSDRVYPPKQAPRSFTNPSAMRQGGLASPAVPESGSLWDGLE